VALGLKLGLLWLTFGGDLIANYWSQLKHRVDVGGTIGMTDVMAKLINHLWQIAWGSKELGYAIMFAALLIIIFSLVWVLIWGVNKDDRIKFVGLLGSVFVIAAWFTLFRNHTYVHAGAFMTRLLAWPIAVAGAMLIWISRSSLPDRALPR
jgi:hypothetical protein